MNTFMFNAVAILAIPGEHHAVVIPVATYGAVTLFAILAISAPFVIDTACAGAIHAILQAATIVPLVRPSGNGNACAKPIAHHAGPTGTNNNGRKFGADPLPTGPTFPTNRRRLTA